MTRLRPILRPSSSLLLIWVCRARLVCPPRRSNIRFIGQYVGILVLTLVNGVFVVVNGGVVVHDALGFLGLQWWRGYGSLGHFGCCCEDSCLFDIGYYCCWEIGGSVCVKRVVLILI